MPDLRYINPATRPHGTRGQEPPAEPEPAPQPQPEPETPAVEADKDGD